MLVAGIMTLIPMLTNQIPPVYRKSIGHTVTEENKCEVDV